MFEQVDKFEAGPSQSILIEATLSCDLRITCSVVIELAYKD